MSDVLESDERTTRLIYGRPEVVEAELARVTDTYACANLFFYVVEGHLEVCATLIHMREIRKAQFLHPQMPIGQRKQ